MSIAMPSLMSTRQTDQRPLEYLGAVFAIDAADSVAGENTVVNRGSGGSALDAQYGSTAGVDTNDPQLLTHNGINYVYFTGITGNVVVTAHSPAIGSLNVFEFIVKVRLNQIGVQQYLAGTDSTHFSMKLSASNNIIVGCLNATFSVVIGDTGTGAVPSLVAGEDIWLRGRVTISDAGCESWYSRDATNDPDAVTWTQIGTRTIGANAGATPALSTTTSAMYGSHSSGIAGYAGRFYAGKIIFDGVTRSKVTFNGNILIVSGSGTPAGPTVLRSTSGRKTVIVTRPVWLFGTDDYLAVLDNDLLDFTNAESYTVVAVVRQWGTPAVSTQLVTKTQGLSGGLYPGYGIGQDGIAGGVRIRVKDGTVTSYTDSYPLTSGTLYAITGVVTPSLVYTYRGNSTTGGWPNAVTTTYANNQPFFIGCVPGGLYSDFECLAVGVFRRALTAAEVSHIVSAYNEF